MRYTKFEEYILTTLKEDLPETLKYHCYLHTVDVLNVCNDYVEKLSLADKDAKLLKLGALMHDIGFLETYANHEKKGVEMCRKMLPNYGYEPDEIEIVCRMIMATKVPQQPQTELEKILCDADLDYLGRDDFERIAEYLFEELSLLGKINSRKEWNKLQIKFLKEHRYHTDWAIQNRKPSKLKHLEKLERIVTEKT